MTGLAPAQDDGRLAALLEHYRPLPGVADELLDADGRVRPAWQPFLSEFACLEEEEIEHAILRARQYLRDAGVFFRHYGPDAEQERDWPLSPFPLLVAEAEWNGIAAALSQRADLLEQVMADLYGPNRLVAEGILPPELLSSNPEWLRPLVGIAPASGHHLHFIAFDIGRGPDGQWWVLGDRTQAPSGAGFALETRMATARGFSPMMARSNVRRLAGFFRSFRDTLLDLRSNDGSRVGIFTPGPLNDTYFEHAYIARYLGFMLVQGEDLGTRDGKLKVRTVGGWKPVSVIWRRLDSAWCDPLELEETSRLGTPGLLGALRSGTVTMINSIGSGVLETRALLAFMPAIARHLTGKPLAMPNIATWWCGSQEARSYVKANLDRMTLDAALSTRLPFDHGPDVVIAGRTTGGKPVNPDWIDQQAGGLAAQEIVSLSTAPALADGTLQPRPMSLRVFLARTPDGWKVMPGGFARIGHDGSTASIAMQRGGSVCDVWVVSGTAEARDTLLPAPATGFRRIQLGALPARAADNLFWLGRYVERAEQKIRLLRAWHLRLAESGRADLPLIDFLSSHLDANGLDMAKPLPQGLLDDVRAAMNSAGAIRDRFSTDGWNALVDLDRTARDMAQRLQAGDDAARAMSVLLRKISGFTGLVHENMYRFTGWRFLSIGRAVERAWATSGFLSAFTAPDAPDGALDLAIEAGDSIMTQRRRYAVSTTRNTVIDLMLLDEMNPRSVHHQLKHIREHLDFLPVPDTGIAMTPMRRAVMKLETELATSTADVYTPEKLAEVTTTAASLTALLSETYLR
ncbi:MAG: circularly permuted type 2 ATP-grasp protein [Notoacmeibacter sp.]|nr:circularly permuted type 2 ATP-grasp protein [Notoacmeibacter sp.]